MSPQELEDHGGFCVCPKCKTHKHPHLFIGCDDPNCRACNPRLDEKVRPLITNKEPKRRLKKLQHRCQSLANKVKQFLSNILDIKLISLMSIVVTVIIEVVVLGRHPLVTIILISVWLAIAFFVIWSTDSWMLKKRKKGGNT